MGQHYKVDTLRPMFSQTDGTLYYVIILQIIWIYQNFFCFRYLATGISFRALSFSFRMGETTVNKIVREVCVAIKNIVMPLYIPKPSKDMWRNIEADFYLKWNFPNCLGAVDGKHVHIFAPKNSGSTFFNYKGTFSIVLMAVVDANYKFIMIDVGSYGGNSDGGVFAHSSFGKAWLTNDHNLNLPERQALPSTENPLPLILVADEAFPLKENILRPFPGKNLDERERVFNYRLSRARRVVENAFGITAHVWRILLKRIEVKNVEFATNITVACCTLHNYLLTENTKNETRANSSTEWTTQPNANNYQNNRYSRPNKRAMDIRNAYADWCVSPAGEVPWQYEAIKH